MRAMDALSDSSLSLSSIARKRKLGGVTVRLLIARNMA